MNERIFTISNAYKRISEVCGYEYSYIPDSGGGFLYLWQIKTLSDQEISKIIEFDNHELFMFLISQYGKSKCPEDKKSYFYSVQSNNLPNNVQIAIAHRQNWDEIKAFTQHWEFSPEAQKEFWSQSENNHALRDMYIERYGLIKELQQKLIVQGDEEAIRLHYKHHGFCFEVEREYLFSKGYDWYKSFIDEHELSPDGGQQCFCYVATTNQFINYIEKYGFWNHVHPIMIELRSDEEIKHYITKHRFLSEEGEQALAKKKDHNLILYYIDNKCYTYNKKDLYSLRGVLKKYPNEFNLEIMLCSRYSETWNWKEFELKFINEASQDDIKKYIERVSLSPKSLEKLCELNYSDLVEYYFKRYHS